MTSHELANKLLSVPDQLVLSWCPDAGDWAEVTCFTYGADDKSQVRLYNDADE